MIEKKNKIKSKMSRQTRNVVTKPRTSASNGHVNNCVRTTRHEVKLTFILRFGSSRNTFYLYTIISVACNSTPCNAHAWLYRGCGYYTDLSVPCIWVRYM